MSSNEKTTSRILAWNLKVVWTNQRSVIIRNELADQPMRNAASSTLAGNMTPTSRDFDAEHEVNMSARHLF